MSLTSGSTTETLARSAYSRHTTTTPTHRRDSATGRSRALVSVSTAKPSAPPKPPRDTMHAFTRLRGLRLADPGSPRNPEDSHKHNPDRLIFSLPLLSQDAARLWTCVWHPPLPQQPEADAAQAAFDRRTTNSRPSRSRDRFAAPWCGQRTGAHTQQSPERYNTQQTSKRAETVNKCQQHLLSIDGNMKSKLPSSSEEQP